MGVHRLPGDILSVFCFHEAFNISWHIKDEIKSAIAGKLKKTEAQSCFKEDLEAFVVDNKIL